MTWKKDGLGLFDMVGLLLRLPLGFKNLVTDGEPITTMTVNKDRQEALPE